MYSVLLERAAEKDLSRLPAETHDRVIEAIQALAANPRPVGCRKLTGSKNDQRYDRVFIYNNGASSYFAARGFCASLRVRTIHHL